MTPRPLCRIAAGLLAFFAAAHTYGMLAPKEPTVQAAEVRALMDSVHFDITGLSRSYSDFYFGFGMLLSTFLVFSAWLAWRLGGLADGAPTLARPLLAGLAVTVVVVAAICWRWFFIPPAATATLAAVALAAAAARTGRR